MIATMTDGRVGEVLGVEVADAWFEYQAATGQLVEPRYGEVEPWAWNRLQRRLEAIEKRSKVLREPARRTDTAEGSSPAGAPGTEGDGA